MPVKRKRKADAPSDADENSLLISSFRQFQVELDSKHDKHERLVKLSRDVTIESKRTIFMLQRVVGNAPDEKILDEALLKLREIEKSKFTSIAKELDSEDPYRFLRAYSPGLQEYIEAVSFYHYLKNRKLITLEEIQQDLTFNETQLTVEGIDNGLSQLSTQKTGQVEPEPVKSTAQNIETIQSEPITDQTDQIKPGSLRDQGHNEETQDIDNRKQNLLVFVPPTEYMLGLGDLTGELMRLAVSSVGKGDLDTPLHVRDFLQLILAGFTSFGQCGKEIGRKVYTLKQSLQKVETACYTLKVRGSEIPKHMLVDVLSSGGSDYVGSFDNDID